MVRLGKVDSKVNQVNRAKLDKVVNKDNPVSPVKMDRVGSKVSPVKAVKEDNLVRVVRLVNRVPVVRVAHSRRRWRPCQRRLARSNRR